jgi:hypothetical protein
MDGNARMHSERHDVTVVAFELREACELEILQQLPEVATQRLLEDLIMISPKAFPVLFPVLALVVGQCGVPNQRDQRDGRIALDYVEVAMPRPEHFVGDVAVVALCDANLVGREVCLDHQVDRRQPLPPIVLGDDHQIT